jgi:large subunit ribosomal protein L7/L12
MAQKSFERMIDDIGGMSVLELSEFVKALESKFGVSASMPVAAMPAAGAVAAAEPAKEEKAEFKVTLQAGGEKKIDVIKALREHLQLTLADAKKAYEETPAILGEAIAKDKAQALKAALEKVGAKVELS